MARKLTKQGPSFGLHEPRVAHLKPARFSDYLTLGELAREVAKDPSWIRKLESQDRLPIPVRHKIGDMPAMRLYSPAQVLEVKAILKTLKRGRPRKNGG